MKRQPRYNPYASSDVFSNGAASQNAPDHTVARDRPEFDSRPAQDLPLVVRGQQRYAIYCIACHSALGDGDGIVVRHGLSKPPTFHQDRLRSASDAYLENVIQNGFGKMYPMADRIDHADREAIVSYIRALQLSQNAQVKDLPPEIQHSLSRTKGASK